MSGKKDNAQSENKHVQNKKGRSRSDSTDQITNLSIRPPQMISFSDCFYIF